MNISKTKDIGSILIGILFLLSSSGFFLNQHYCMGEMKSVSLRQTPNNKDLCAKNTSKHCGNHQTKECCEDEVIKIETDEYISISQKFSSESQIPLFIVHIPSPIKSINTNQNCSFKIYKPPPINFKKLQVLYQTFLL